MPKQVQEDERLFAELARQSPSAAGMYITPDGVTHVLVVQPADDKSAQAAIAGLRASGQMASEGHGSSAVVIERAQYTFAELAQWRDLVFDSIFVKVHEAVVLDLDERRNRVVIGIDRSAPGETRNAIARAVARLGIEPGAVVTEAIAAPKWESGASQPANLTTMFTPASALDQYWDSIPGGVQVLVSGMSGACTNGLVVEHNGVPKMVLPTHCTPQWGGLDNSTVSQGGAIYTRGTETNDPGSYWCGLDHCRSSDAALFTLSPNIHYKRGRIARPTSRSRSTPGPIGIDPVNPYFEVTAIDVDNTITGQEVQKIGWKTGWTYGYVSNTCVDHKNGPIYGAWLITRCTYRADYLSDYGDSGAPVIKWSSGASALIVGTAIGDGFFSKFTRIKDEMGGTMIVAAVDERPLGAQISGPNYLPANTPGQWNSNYFGGTAPYTFTWTVDGQTITNTSILNFTFTSSGQRSINLVLRDATGATVNRSYSVFVY